MTATGTDPHGEGVPFHLFAAVEPRPDLCEHERPDHQTLIRHLADALGWDLPALAAHPEQVWAGLIGEVERLRRERDGLLLLVDNIGQNCADAIGGRDMNPLRRASITRSATP